MSHKANDIFNESVSEYHGYGGEGYSEEGTEAKCLCTRENGYSIWVTNCPNHGKAASDNPLREILDSLSRWSQSYKDEAERSGKVELAEAAIRQYFLELPAMRERDVLNIFPFPNWQVRDEEKFQALAAEIINWHIKEIRKQLGESK